MEVREPVAKYLARPAFKQTEVGLIPEDWDYIQLTSVAQLESGHTPSRRHPEYWNGDIPWVSLHDSDSLDRREIQRTAQTVTVEGINNSSARLLPKGTVVFSRTATVGKATTLGQDMATSQDFANYICGPKVLNHFLVYLFRWMAPEWKKLMAGSIHNTVYMPAFKTLKVVLPPRVEQQAIAEALSDADALIGALEHLLAKKRQIKQGAMQELLTGQKRLPGFAGEWEVKRLGNVAQLRKDRLDPRQVGAQEFCIELEHIDQGSGALVGHGIATDESSQKSVFREGDVLFGKLRAYLRKYWLADREGVCSTEIWVLIAKPLFLVPQFLFQIVMTDRFIEAASSAYGTHMPRSDWNVVKNFEINLPPREEQTAIAAVLSDMDAEIAAIDAKLAKARAVKQGMMQELLTGRIRLV